MITKSDQFAPTKPSVVTAAKTVDEYGAQQTSPTWKAAFNLCDHTVMHNWQTALPRSKEKTGAGQEWSQIFTDQSVEHEANTRGCAGFHTTE